MSERFEQSPIQLRPESGGVVEIKSGAITVRAEEDEPPTRDGVPVPPPKEHGWDAKIKRQTELLSEMRIEGEDAEKVLEDALVEHSDADRVEIASSASAMSKAELGTLLAVSRRHRVPIDIYLDADG